MKDRLEPTSLWASLFSFYPGMMAENQDDPFSCSICLESFTEPKLLSCYHTFCLECIRTYIQRNSHAGQFSCPLCRTRNHVPAGGADGLQCNFYITGTRDEKGRKCSKHPRELIRFHCQICNRFICRDCKLTDHEGHKSRDICDILREDKHALLITASIIKADLSTLEDINQKEILAYSKLVSSSKTVKWSCLEQVQQMIRKCEKEVNDYVAEKSREMAFRPINIAIRHKLLQNIADVLNLDDIVAFRSRLSTISESIAKLENPKPLNHAIAELRLSEPLPSTTLRVVKKATMDVSLVTIHRHNLVPLQSVFKHGICYICPSENRALLVDVEGNVVLVSMDGTIIKSYNTKCVKEIRDGVAYSASVRTLFLNSRTIIYALSMDGSITPFPYLGESRERRIAICKGCDSREYMELEEDEETFVVLHSISGVYPVISTICTRSGRVLFRIPIDARVDARNGQIAKFESVYCSGVDDRVYMMDGNGIVINTYTPPKHKSLTSCMHVSSICFDNRGNAYITDTNNHAVHVLDPNGFFVKLLLTKEDGIRKPMSVEVDESDRLWLAHSDNNILVGQLQYQHDKP